MREICIMYIGDLAKRDRNENVFARLNGLREDAEIAISRKGPGPARKKERGVPVVGMGRKKMRRFLCPCGKAIDNSHIVGENVKSTRRNGM